MPGGPHQLIFFVGLHGSGKTTLGRRLQAEHGWKHFSVGDFARKARKHARFEDVPLSLMIELARQEPNARMGQRLVELLVAFLLEWNRTTHVVCDGFPSEPMHLQHLPAYARMVHVTCMNREQRLVTRSETTPRLWTPGALSLRDRMLPHVIQAATTLGMVSNLSNDKSLDESMQHLRDLLSIAH